MFVDFVINQDGMMDARQGFESQFEYFSRTTWENYEGSLDLFIARHNKLTLDNAVSRALHQAITGHEIMLSERWLVSKFMFLFTFEWSSNKARIVEEHPMEFIEILRQSQYFPHWQVENLLREELWTYVRMMQ